MSSRTIPSNFPFCKRGGSVNLASKVQWMQSEAVDKPRGKQPPSFCVTWIFIFPGDSPNGRKIPGRVSVSILTVPGKNAEEAFLDDKGFQGTIESSTPRHTLNHNSSVFALQRMNQATRSNLHCRVPGIKNDTKIDSSEAHDQMLRAEAGSTERNPEGWGQREATGGQVPQRGAYQFLIGT
ncbi:hypothetical protein DL98DRAFT_569708 [Cadophora sp. DSE1049]|nr:hypothetical protein DL98DRAFT_569708 [Cadophora sp. DSE1049]